MGRNRTIEDDEVLARAREIFRRDGHAASTRDIARAAGISQAVLYQRFGSKEEMFFRAMTPEVPDLEALIGPYPPKDAYQDLRTLSERLLELLRAFVPTLLHVLAVPGVDSAKLEAWHSQLPFFPIVGAIAERFRKLEADGLVSPGDARARAVAVLSGVHSLAFFEGFTTPTQRAHFKANLDALVTVLWHGLAPDRPRQEAPPIAPSHSVRASGKRRRS